MVARVNIICGPLGSGKSTAILAMLQQQPKDETWAVLVNEIGDVGIDGVAMGREVFVRELAGGCMCCANGLPFRVALTELLRRKRPDRVLVEPSGLGRISEIFKLLREAPLATAINLAATICVVPADKHDALWGASDVYADQLYGADALVVNRRDTAVPDAAAAVEGFCRAFYPPKHVALATRGRFDAKLLDATPTDRVIVEPTGLVPAGGTTRVDCGDGATRIESEREGRRLVGWLLRGWRFDRKRLENGLAALATPPLDRAKAVFLTRGQGVFLAHWWGTAAVDLSTIPAVAGDSRVQLIFEQQDDTQSATHGTSAVPFSFPSLRLSATANQERLDYVERFQSFLHDARLSKGN
ncbi:hypothetical protein CTAYLR_006942 [Chrysophaeum taylorii]|uniref:CobW/HypB/UreG nucleotide-binding domain-containing protein n=1 Tax=Chrysophaeum taylorii TaxID=2483200 RepID=A0AAD7XKR8_9STRA|nr:hypothetical protein CTAYLR_006942 [Chrysophaeum taylorii]